MPTRLTRQHGAILIESIVALAFLSVCTAAIFHAFDQVQVTSHAASELAAKARGEASQSGHR